MSFDDFNFIDEIRLGIENANYEKPTLIQQKSIPEILNKKDILAISQTGTGKTAAFTFPILQLMSNNIQKNELEHPEFVILAPTRELVAQIGDSIRKYSKHTKFRTEFIYGGMKEEVEKKTLSKLMDILVTTPKKLANLIKNKKISLKNLNYFVVDEADKIIQLSGTNDLHFISQNLPKQRQSLFFSATFDEEIEKLANKILKQPIRIKVDDVEHKNTILEKVLYVKKEQKNNLLLFILQKKTVKNGIIFLNTKKDADDMVRFLTENKIKSEALHSNKSNTHRSKVVNHLKTGVTKFLIATDLASRGLDIDNIDYVINYDIPPKVEDYIHRIGRTGRAGSTGYALSFCSSEERNFVKKIEQKRDLELMTHPYHSEIAMKAKGKEAEIKHKTVKHTFRPKSKKKKRGYNNRKGKF